MNAPATFASHLASERGFSLLEAVATILLLGLIATVSTQIFTNNSSAQRYEETRAKMEQIRIAIIGDDALDAKGQKIHHGYYGDMGMLPATLSSLTTQGSQPSWTYDTALGIGAGWRGPYFADQFTTAASISTDAFGAAFSWVTAGTPTLTSFGSDKAAGTTGDVYSKDLAMTFTSAAILSTVRGYVRDGDTRVPNAIVQMNFPSKGAITTYAVAADANGEFIFRTIPFGYSAIAVTSVPVTGKVQVGPRQISVANPQFLVPNFLMNYYGAKQKVAMGTVSSSTNTITLPLISSYEIAVNIDRVTMNWDGGAMTLQSVKVGAAATETFGTCITSGTLSNVFANGSVMAANGTTYTNVVFTMRNDAACTGTPTVTGRNYYLQIQWKDTTEIDVLSFNL